MLIQVCCAVLICPITFSWVYRRQKLVLIEDCFNGILHILYGNIDVKILGKVESAGKEEEKRPSVC